MTKFSKIITKNIAAVAVLAVILSAFISYHLVSASAKKIKV